MHKNQLLSATLLLQTVSKHYVEKGDLQAKESDICRKQLPARK